MPTRRTPLRRAAKQTFSPAVIDAGRRGDTRALRHALDLPPWKYTPLTRSFGPYCLPSIQPKGDTAMEQGWAEIKSLQDRLYEIAGEPGGDVQE